jgi:hypothetical protein
MTIQKNFISTLVFMLFSILAFSQKSNIIYPQIVGKNGSFSMNYDRKLGFYHDATGHFTFYGHIGIGKNASQEIIATKFVKGQSSTHVHLNDILLDILFNLVNTNIPDQTIERRQFFDVTNAYLGGKILLGKGKFNGIIGLDVRFDRVNQKIEAWENIPMQTKNYTKTALFPSAGIRYNVDNFMVQLLLEPQKIYGIQGGTDAVVSMGIGFKF